MGHRSAVGGRRACSGHCGSSLLGFGFEGFGRGGWGEVRGQAGEMASPKGVPGAARRWPAPLDPLDSWTGRRGTAWPGEGWRGGTAFPLPELDNPSPHPSAPRPSTLITALDPNRTESHPFPGRWGACASCRPSRSTQSTAGGAQCGVRARRRDGGLQDGGPSYRHARCLHRQRNGLTGRSGLPATTPSHPQSTMP